MSLPSFQLWRLWTPPSVPSCCSATCTVPAALATLNARGDVHTTVRPWSLPSSSHHHNTSGESASSATATTASTSQPVRLLTVHPTQPLCAYVVGGGGGGGGGGTATTAPSSSDVGVMQLLVIQDLESGQVLGCFAWQEVAACLYGEKNAGKLPAAMKSLGKLTQLTLMDAQTNFWNGVVVGTGNSASTGAVASAIPPCTPLWLVVQTTSRILVLSPRPTRFSGAVLVNQHKATRQAWFVSHLHEKSLGGIPSSNLLALDAHLWLVGCSDGTLKAWDKSTHAPTKSIKGLGKGDWIVQILAANRYATTASGHGERSAANLQSSSSGTGTSAAAGAATTTASTTPSPPKRILTVTKKHSVYLIELETHPLEIKPPLARFGLPESLAGGEDDAALLDSGAASTAMEHTIVSYDAHRDWLLWLVPSSKKSNPITTLLVWNLKALQPEFVKHTDSKTMFRPEPTLTVQFPAASAEAAMTVLSVVHAAFSDATTTCAVATSDGEVYVQAATASATSNTKTIAVPVMGQSLSQLFQHTWQLDAPPPVHITSLHAQPLGERPLLVLSTNYGIVALEWATHLHSGSRHVHFGSGLGSLGKSVLCAAQSEIRYASLDVVRPNPMGYVDASKNAVVVHESTPGLNWPAEYQKRPFRIAPTFLPSPSGIYICVFWAAEFRYEVLHVPSILQKVTQRNNPGQVAATRNPVVATGAGITSFAWVGDHDDYAILHAEDVMEHAAMLLATAPVLVVPTAEGGLTLSLPGLNPTNINMSNLIDIRAGAMGVANLTSSAVKGATSATLSATKAATSAAANVTLNATKAATNVTLTATKAATDATLKVTKATKTTTKNVTKTVTKGVKKSFGIFGKKKKSDDSDGPSNITADDDDDEEDNMTGGPVDMATLGNMQPLNFPSEHGPSAPKQTASRHFVELRTLVPVESQSNELAMSVAAATSSSLGELSLRGGNRNVPTLLHGGPVLIVASRSEEDQEGYAQFYTRKNDESDNKASAYVSTGPTLPFPDLCEWDEDGVLCAIVLQNRIAIYQSAQPNFTLLGMLRIPNSGRVVSLKFIHGVVYFTTWNSVHCVFLGTLEGTGVCPMDLYTLASAVVSTTSETSIGGDYTSIVPPIIPLPLVQPVVLGYQSGSLLLSSARGTFMVPMIHPLLRMGVLLAAGQVERATKWLDAFPNRDSEALAVFLERRGHPALAISLPELSLESTIDLCMRFGYVGRLEEAVEEFGVKGLRAIDMSRGVASGMLGPEMVSTSIVVCVGAYLLAHGKVELTRRLATELLRSGEDGRKDAFVLATLLLTVDEDDASRLIARAVDNADNTSKWLLGDFVRDFVIHQSN